jgi:hypothetical protein
MAGVQIEFVVDHSENYFRDPSVTGGHRIHVDHTLVTSE